MDALQVVTGSLAPSSAVVKLSGKLIREFKGVWIEDMKNEYLCKCVFWGRVLAVQEHKQAGNKALFRQGGSSVVVLCCWVAGTAICFESEADAFRGVMQDEVRT